MAKHQQYPPSHGYTHIIRSSNRTTIHKTTTRELLGQDDMRWHVQVCLACFPTIFSFCYLSSFMMLFRKQRAFSDSTSLAVKDNVAWRDVMLMRCRYPPKVGYRAHLSHTSPPRMPKVLDRAKDRLKKRRVWGYVCVVQQQFNLTLPFVH